ncbi:PilZ domain-containing protein [Candidatus Omnitrophota bacterium]
MADTYSGSERRRFKRVPAKFLVTCKASNVAEALILFNNKKIDALMFDLSEGGMAIVTNDGIPIGTRLSIEFTLINDRAFNDSDKFRTLSEIKGEIRNDNLLDKNQHRLGIQFDSINRRDKLAIANFVKATII